MPSPVLPRLISAPEIEVMGDAQLEVPRSAHEHWTFPLEGVGLGFGLPHGRRHNAPCAVLL